MLADGQVFLDFAGREYRARGTRAAYFADHLPCQHFDPRRIRSYRDTLKLFLVRVAKPVTRPKHLADLSCEHALAFLRTRDNLEATACAPVTPVRQPCAGPVMPPQVR